MLYQARQPAAPPAQPMFQAKPSASGYEKYRQPDYIPQLEANASLWGLGPKKNVTPVQMQQEAKPPAPSGRKMMSLEEVEASMRASQTRPQALPAQQHLSSDIPNVASFLAGSAPAVQPMPPQQHAPQLPPFAGPPQILQRPPQLPEQRHQQPPVQAELPAPAAPQHPQILQRQRTPQHHGPPQQKHMPQPAQARQESPQPRTILQNPNRLAGQGQPLAPQRGQQQPPQFPPAGSGHHRGPSYQGQLITDPQQILNLSEQDRVHFLAEEAKRAKRNHKIHLLSKHNGLMTPQDKNYITRIQLTSLVSATGNVDSEEGGPESALAEDFYYQVYSSIRTAPRQNPNQPVNQFAQTYLFATHGRYGRLGGRGVNRGDNHMQRMEQQVQRAVEVAKSKPKNKQLVIEGSLGKISFSNAKTPKPLLNIKRPESSHDRPASANQRRPSRANLLVDRKVALRDIENVYSTLLQLEGHERRVPSPVADGSSPEQIQQHMEWRQRLQELHEKLWKELKVMEPIVSG